VRIQLGRIGEKLAARLADLEAGRVVPATPRDAATVMVLRRAPDGKERHRIGCATEPASRGDDPPGEYSNFALPGEAISLVERKIRALGPPMSAFGGRSPGGTASEVEVLMLRRTAAMKFAPGAYVFPGGSVDPADYDAEVGWQGPSPAEFGTRLGASAEVARALVCAAVRETFEESGVLLAGAPGEDPASPLAAPSGPSWEADRMALAAGTVSLAEFLSRRGLVIRADLLVPWAHWITPEGESRRFDTRFFAAALPDGQEAVGHEAEADHAAWLRPADALASAKAGEISLLPPTATTLSEFASAVAAGDGLADILATRRAIQPVQPRLVLADGAAWLVLPEGVEYPL
jgi:8-oxo-dGTP pyrophosphatase MutT (NUDIX family)